MASIRVRWGFAPLLATPTMTSPLSSDSTIQTILDAVPGAAGLLNGLGLDTCCSRGLSLKEACEHRGLETGAILLALKAGAHARNAPAELAPENGTSPAGLEPATSIRTILARWPAAEPVFRRHGLMECGGPGGPDEPIEFFARVHHVPLPALLRDLERAIQHPPAPEAALPSRPAVAEPPRRFVPFFIASLVLTLTLGATLGMINLARLTAAWGWGTLERPWVWAHAYVQVFGFVALFVMGVAYHVMPRFAGTPLAAPRVVPWSFWLQVAGVVTIAAGFLFGAPVAVLVAGGVALTAAAILFATAIARTLLAAAPSPEPFERWVLAGCGWLIVASGLAIVTLATADPIWHHVLWPAALLGFAGSWIFGVGRRIFPVFLTWQPRWPGAEWTIFVLYQLGVAAWSAGAWPADLTLFSVLRAAGALMLVAAVISYTHVLGVVPGLLERWRLPAGPMDRGYGPYIYAAWAWLLVGLLFGPVWTLGALAQGRYGSMAMLDFARHAFALGFVTQMIMGVASRVVPVFTGRDLWSPTARTLTFWLLNASVAIRGLEAVVAAGFWPGAWSIIAWSGPPAVAAVTLFAANIILTVRAKPQASPAREVPNGNLADARVADLLQIPGGLEVLVEAGFTPLRNPVMRATFAQTVTLRQACRLRHVPLESLVGKLEALGRPAPARTGEGAHVIPLAQLRRGARG
jgi:hypothetical protein